MTRVAIQGIAGSYSEEAARRLFGTDASIVECRNFDQMFASLRSEKADRAVVPVMNKIAGIIEQPTRLIMEGNFKILDKFDLPIRHALLGTTTARMEDLQSVRSHPEALKQCERFIAANERVKQRACSDTASGIREIVEEADPSQAAIGSVRAAEMYGATVLLENIADDIDNWTTFYLIGS